MFTNVVDVLDVARRIRTMRGYGMSREDIRGEIVFSSEVPEDMFFLAWCAALCQEGWA